jgi:3-hydroxyacyl-[acyl-carrier-protein] dehydratase
MSLDNFYNIIDQVEIDNAHLTVDYPVRKFIFTLKLNPEHPVYDGHFPGNPVVPGVCQVQMIKELTSAILKTDLVIQHSDNIKFLSMIIPSVTPLLTVSMDIKEKEPGSWNVNSVISNADQIFLKFKGVFRSV